MHCLFSLTNYRSSQRLNSRRRSRLTRIPSGEDLLDFDFQFAARKGDHVGHGVGVEDAAAVGTEETDGIEQLLELVEGIIDGIGMAV